MNNSYISNYYISSFGYLDIIYKEGTGKHFDKYRKAAHPKNFNRFLHNFTKMREP